MSTQGHEATTEIEVTPAMIEAGLLALREWIDSEDRYTGHDARGLTDAFLVMTRLSPGRGASGT